MKLFIVESPGKIKSIFKILGREFKIMASMGHINDLPKREMGVNTDTFEPKYIISSNKINIVADIKKAACKATTIYLATDPDREGEAIAWQLSTLLKRQSNKIKRVRFNEITPNAIITGIKDAGCIDYNLADAQQARRIIDRIIGYEVSPKLWKYGRGLSAGRVQSATLHLVVEREKERTKHIPIPYWVVKVKYDNGIVAEYAERDKDTGKFKPKKLESEEKALNVIRIAEKKKHVVEKVAKRTVSKRPDPPFITSSLQQIASNKLNLKPDKTMQLAQKLYDEGKITYHRTDSVSISKTGTELARLYIKNNYPDCLPDKPPVYKTKKRVEAAHEAIRPTSINQCNDITGDEKNLYILISKRFIASQCKPAVLEKTNVITVIGEINFLSTTTVIKSRGYLKILDNTYKEEKQINNDIYNFTVNKGDEFWPVGFTKDKKFTKPPSRFTTAELLKEMEKRGIGRPSTYAQTIKILLSRKYIEDEKRAICPTELGIFIDGLLEKGFNNIVQHYYTETIEKNLDEIASGNVFWKTFLADWYKMFSVQVKTAEIIFNKNSDSDKFKDMEMKVVKGVRCPECSSEMILRKGKNGNFYGCSNYPTCKGIAFPEKKFVKGMECPLCSSGMYEKKGKYGKFYSCSNYPDCNGIIKHKKKRVNPVGVKCDKCGAPMIEKKSKFGKFFGCSKYPKCNFISKSFKSSSTIGAF